MPIKKWTIQYLIALPALCALFAGVQYLKGHTVGDALEFGLLWSVISVTIFALRRAYNFRQNIACQMCNDLPTNKNENLSE